MMCSIHVQSIQFQVWAGSLEQNTMWCRCAGFGALSCWLEPRHRPIRVEHGQEPTAFKDPTNWFGTQAILAFWWSFGRQRLENLSRINVQLSVFSKRCRQKCQRQVGFQLLVLDIVLNLSRASPRQYSRYKAKNHSSGLQIEDLSPAHWRNTTNQHRQEVWSYPKGPVACWISRQRHMLSCSCHNESAASFSARRSPAMLTSISTMAHIELHLAWMHNILVTETQRLARTKYKCWISNIFSISSNDLQHKPGLGVVSDWPERLFGFHCSTIQASVLEIWWLTGWPAEKLCINNFSENEK